VNLRRLKRNWNSLGEIDPLWSVLTVPGRRGRRWDADEFFASGRDEVEHVLMHLRSLEIELRFGKALDFGCGPGRLSQALAIHFNEVHGVDIAPSMIQVANKYNRYGDRCRYHLNDSDDLSVFPRDSLDFVYSSITLQHMEPRYAKAYLAEFLRLLKPRGVLMFQLTAERLPAVERSRRAVLRSVVKALTPAPVMDLYRGVTRRPEMEMHGIRKDEVLALLVQHGGIVVDVQPDSRAGGWTGFLYCVIKQDARGAPETTR
jgi:SAM-dependent methyltransferase